MVSRTQFRCPCECEIPQGGFCARHGITKSKNWVNLCRNDLTYWSTWEAGTGPGQPHPKVSEELSEPPKTNPAKRQQYLLGDCISSALSLVGITEDRVSKWLGRPCGCSRRREKLNRLDSWARGVISKTIDDAKESLERIIGK